MHAEDGKMKRSLTVLLLALVLGLGAAFVVSAGLSKFAAAGDNADVTVDNNNKVP
jgi:hypothetical protein